MIIKQSNVTREQIIELFLYSSKPECLFLHLIEGAEELGLHGRRGLETVIHFSKVEEVSTILPNSQGLESKMLRFAVEIYVEESYWEECEGELGGHSLTGEVPLRIQDEVERILSNENNSQAAKIMKEADLIKNIEIEGFCFEDRIQCLDVCVAVFRGKEGAVVGFDRENNIWIKLDGQEGLFSIAGAKANKFMKKL